MQRRLRGARLWRRASCRHSFRLAYSRGNDGTAGARAANAELVNVQMQPLKIGIVGAGAIAQRNATEAAKSGVATIAGVFDVNHKVARDMAQALKAPFCPTYEALLETPGLEAVL